MKAQAARRFAGSRLALAGAVVPTWVGCCPTAAVGWRGQSHASACARDLTGAVCEPWAAGAEESAGELKQMLCRAAGLRRRAEPELERKPGVIGTCVLAGWRLRGDGIAVYKYIKGVNTREGRELFKLRDNAGMRTNSTNWP